MICFQMYEAADADTDTGRPEDEVGRELKYTCEEIRCSMRKMVGYKEFVIHKSTNHGKLDEALSRYENEPLKILRDKLLTLPINL